MVSEGMHLAQLHVMVEIIGSEMKTTLLMITPQISSTARSDLRALASDFRLLCTLCRLFVQEGEDPPDVTRLSF